MTIYTIVLFFHVSGAIGYFVSMGTWLFCLSALRRAQRVEQVLLRQPVVGARVVRRHAALVDEEDPRAAPVDHGPERRAGERIEEKAGRRASRERRPEDSVVREPVGEGEGDLPRRGPGRFGGIGQHANLEPGRTFRRKLLLHFPSVRQRRPSFSRNRSAASGPSVPAA